MTEKEQVLCVSFFDASHPGKPIYLENPSLKIRAGKATDIVSVHGGEKKSTAGVQPGKQKSTREVHGNAYAGHEQQYIDLPKNLLQELLGNKDEVVAELSLTGRQEVGCTRYVGSSVSFVLKNADPCSCSCIPIPLHQVQEACRIKFGAFDSSFADYVENAKSFLNGVEWTVTAVEARVIAHGSARQFQSFTAAATSVEGSAEIAEVPQHQLYRIETRGPEGYISDGSAVEYVFVCCETFLSRSSLFCPCGSKPKRSVVFVQQKCPGIRWQGGTVSVGGTELTIDDNGIMNVPDDLDGVLPVTSLGKGKTFSPAFIDLRKGASPVSTVAVADQGTADAGLTIRSQFVDHANVPFARRTVTVLLPNGDEIRVLTDEQGFFEAPRGSRVYAREDDFGLATEPVYLTEEI